MSTSLRFLVPLLIFLNLAATAQESAVFSQLKGVSATDQKVLQHSLKQAIRALAPYKNKALPTDAVLPSEVEQFFSRARQISTKYGLKGSEVLEVPKAFLAGSGRFSQSILDEAFRPLQQLLDRHNVYGIDILDLIVPSLKRDLTEGLKTPPSQRAAFLKKHRKRSKAQINKGIAFANQHRIPLMELGSALQHLSTLK